MHICMKEAKRGWCRIEVIHREGATPRHPPTLGQA